MLPGEVSTANRYAQLRRASNMMDKLESQVWLQHSSHLTEFQNKMENWTCPMMIRTRNDIPEGTTARQGANARCRTMLSSGIYLHILQALDLKGSSNARAWGPSILSSGTNLHIWQYSGITVKLTCKIQSPDHAFIRDISKIFVVFWARTETLILHPRVLECLH